MKNENFKKRLALALVPILSLTSVIGNVPILPTSVFATTTDEESVVETVYSPNEEQDFYIVDPEKAGVPNTFEDIPVLAKDMLNAASTWTVTNYTGTSRVDYKVGDGIFQQTFSTSSGLDFTTIGTDDVLIKIGVDATQTLKTFTYTTSGAPVDLVVDSNGEVVIPNATALNITAINVEFEDIAGTTTAATTTTAAGTTTTATTTTTAAPTTYAISWTATGGSIEVDEDSSSPYAYVKDAALPQVIFTPDSGKVLTAFTVAGVNKLSKVVYGDDISYTFEAKPTKAVAIVATFETIVCSIGDVDFASLASAIAYINAQTTAAAYTIDILDNMATAVALTLPTATKATSITLKTAKENEGTPVSVNVAISNTTLAIPTALILDNVVLTSSAGTNVSLSAAASALTVKAGGGIDKVVNVATAAGKVITLEDTTKFAITGNLSGKPNITIKDDLEIAGSVAIGELTYDAAKKVSFTKAATATATITKISTIGNVAAVLESGILSLTIGDIDVDTATTTGFIIKGRQYTATTDKTPVYQITGTVTIAEDKPVELSVYGKADTNYSALATIDPTTAIITSVKTETTADIFKTSNKNAEDIVYSFYKDGTALKFGNNFITLNAKVAGAAAADVDTFIRLQDAFTYIDGEEDLTEVILKVSGDIPSHGALTFPATDVTIKSSSADAQNKISFTGAVKLNANLTLMDIELSNANIKGIAFDLNGKNLILDTDSKVIFNTIKDTITVVAPATKVSELNIKDSGDLTFLGAITAIGTVNIDDNTIFKGAVSNVVEIDIAAAKYAYFRGGAITNTLTYAAGSIAYLPSTATGGISKNITIKATEDAISGSGKLKVNAVKDTVTAADAEEGTPETIVINLVEGAVDVQKVNPGTVIVKLVKDSDVLASSFVTDSKNNKLETAQTLIATKAGTSIKIAAPKLTLKDTTAEATYEENFVTIEEALGVTLSGTTYKIIITDNIVGADLTNIPAKVTVITAALPTGTDPLLKVVTAKDIGLNGNLIIENLNILAAAKTIGGIVPGEGEEPATYTAATKDLLLSNTSLTVKDAYIQDLTLQQYTDAEDEEFGTSIITFRGKGYLDNLKLDNGSTVGKISSVPVPET